jgi:hypothetical protein
MKTMYYKTNCHFVKHDSTGCKFVNTLDGSEQIGFTSISAFDYCQLEDSTEEEYAAAFKSVIKKLEL